MKSSEEDAGATARALISSAVEARDALPGVLGGKLWLRGLEAARAEKFVVCGREYNAEERKMLLRGAEVVVAPEKLLDLSSLVVARDTIVVEKVEGLLGLSPGIRLGAEMALFDDTCDRSDAETVWDNLLDGPCGRPMTLRAAICDSDARFAGLSGADALLKLGRGSAGAADFTGMSFFIS